MNPTFSISRYWATGILFLIIFMVISELLLIDQNMKLRSDLRRVSYSEMMLEDGFYEVKLIDGKLWVVRK